MSASKRMKRPAVFDGPAAVLTGKRKRATISYVEAEGDAGSTSDNEHVKDAEETAKVDSDEDMDDDFSFRSKASTRKAPPKKKAKKAPKPKKQKKQKFFRFLDLPPELRDIIYEMALVDPRGVTITSSHRGLRQTPYRSFVSTRFIPALLAVNKQINAEAINYVYGHKFVFANCASLFGFLFMIGHRNQQRLTAVKILDWGLSQGGKKITNHTGMTLLAGATNLKSLELCNVPIHQTPAQYAKVIFRDAHLFIEAYGRANGSKDAVVDIISVEQYDFRAHAVVTKKEGDHKMFQRHLRSFANNY